MDFTGSDWCGWCIMLDKEIFSKPEFKEYASKNLVLLELDFPRGKRCRREVRPRTNDLLVNYQSPGISRPWSFSTATGKQVGALGYHAGRPAGLYRAPGEAAQRLDQFEFLVVSKVC